MKCPICRKEITRDNPEFPFCGERCRILDLGNWASGKYVISTPLSSTVSDTEDDELSER
jgi:uncharacterized protein